MPHCFQSWKTWGIKACVNPTIYGLIPFPAHSFFECACTARWRSTSRSSRFSNCSNKHTERILTEYPPQNAGYKAFCRAFANLNSLISVNQEQATGYSRKSSGEFLFCNLLISQAGNNRFNTCFKINLRRPVQVLLGFTNVQNIF